MADTTATTSTAQLWRDGLWNENPGLVKLLGLCPLLAISNTTINGLGLGLATLLTLIVANGTVSLVRHSIQTPIRIPLYVLIIATTVTVIELSMQAWLPALHSSLGIFLPLIVTNCLIMGRAEAFAARQPPKLAIIDAFAMGLGFLAVLLALGTIRELIGQGTLLADASLLFGSAAASWTHRVFDIDNGVLIAVLPPGAFLTLGLMLALKNLIDSRLRAARDTAINSDALANARPGYS